MSSRGRAIPPVTIWYDKAMRKGRAALRPDFYSISGRRAGALMTADFFHLPEK